MGSPRGPSFVLGWFVRYARDPYGVFDALVARFQDPFFVKLPETRGTVVTGHPDGVKSIISADNSTLVPWRLPATVALLSDDSIFLKGGDQHHATRKLLSPLFQASRHGEHCALIAGVVATELDAVSAGPIVIHTLAQEITLRIILAVLFGDRDEARTARFRAAAELALDSQGPALLYIPWLRRRSGRWQRIASGVAQMRALVQLEIDARRSRGDARDGEPPADALDSRQRGAGPDHHPAAMLGQLLRARHPDGRPLADREIQVHLADLVVAGHETTTVAIAWACYELCRHPAVMARLVAEIDGYRAGPPAAAACPHAPAAATRPGPVDGAGLAALPYLAAVCHETLRLHPPLVFLTREVARPLTVRGHEVPPGVGVSIALPLVHRRADVYDAPAAFRPERFLDRTFAPDQFLPFGGGAKRCLGATFAQQEMMIVLGELLGRFAMRLQRDRPVRPRPRIITVAAGGGVEVVLERRPAVAAPTPAPVPSC